MIVLRTKHFGFFNGAGILLERYEQGGKHHNKFLKWKENILEQYRDALRKSGLSTDLSEKEINRILRRQSSARDEAVNLEIQKRRRASNMIDYAKDKIENSQNEINRLENIKNPTLSEAQANTEYHQQLAEGQKALKNWTKERLTQHHTLVNSNSLNNPNRKFGNGSIPGYLEHEVTNSTGLYDKRSIDYFVKDRKATVQKAEDARQAAQAAMERKQQEELAKAKELERYKAEQQQKLEEQQRKHEEEQRKRQQEREQREREQKEYEERRHQEEIARAKEEARQEAEEKARQEQRQREIDAQIEEQNRQVQEKKRKSEEESRKRKNLYTGLGIAGGTAVLGGGIYALSKNNNNNNR